MRIPAVFMKIQTKRRSFGIILQASSIYIAFITQLQNSQTTLNVSFSISTTFLILPLKASIAWLMSSRGRSSQLFTFALFK